MQLWYNLLESDKKMVLETLRRARKEFNYSVDDMTKILGISKSYYYQIENNNRKLDYIMAIRISSIFGLKPDDMFYYYFEDYKKKNRKVKTSRRLIVSSDKKNT